LKKCSLFGIIEKCSLFGIIEKMQFIWNNWKNAVYLE
jgi:hypothetical protein